MFGLFYILRSFNYYMNDKKVTEEADKLASLLTADGITDFTSPKKTFFSGGYDSMFTLPFLRHNEVWLVQTSENNL